MTTKTRAKRKTKADKIAAELLEKSTHLVQALDANKLLQDDVKRAHEIIDGLKSHLTNACRENQRLGDVLATICTASTAAIKRG